MKRGHIQRVGDQLQVQLRGPGPLARRLRSVQGGRHEGDGVWFELAAAQDLLQALGAVQVSWAPEALALTQRAEAGEADFTPATLNQAIESLISRAFPGPVWVTGQIDGWSKGHDLYFDLIDRREDNPRADAKIRAYIPRAHRTTLEETVAGAGLTLRDGLKVRLQGTVGLWVQGGSYQFKVTGVDPHYTLARLEEMRTRVLSQLRQEGIAGSNLALTAPAVPLRVGLISAANSDALEDVLATLQGSGLGFQVVFHPARVQGEHLQGSVLAALRWFYRNADLVDVVCIVRGGGSRSDLAQFDALSIARGVCHQRVPVLIGIGHKTDTCVLDDIAHSYATPTAVGAALVGQVRAYLEAVQQTARRLAIATRRRTDSAQTQGEMAQRRLALATQRITRSADHTLTALTHALGHAAAGHVQRTQVMVSARAFRLAAATGGHLRAEGGRLGGSTGRLRRATQSALRQTTAQLEVQTARQRAVDPARILARGFAIVRGPDGVITSSEEAGAGTHLRIQLHRGTLRATSQGDQNE